MSALKVVVTGANGFVGRHVVAEALGRGHAVHALTRSGKLPSTAPHHALKVQAWEVTSVAAEAFEGADAAIHLAAFVPPDYADASFALECFTTNAVGTVRVLEAARGAHLKSVSVVTSGNAYAAGVSTASEHDALYPNMRAPYYLASKVAADSMADAYRVVHGEPVAVVRVSSVYGAGMKGGFLPLCVQRLRACEPLVLQNGGRARADWVEVNDVARALVDISESQATGPLNIGGGQTHSIRETANIVADVLGADPSLLRVEVPESAKDFPLFPGLDISKARSAFNYQPVSLRTGVERLIAQS